MDERDPRILPKNGDVLARKWYGRWVDYVVQDVSGRAQKVHGPGYVKVCQAGSTDYGRRSFCGSEWRAWAADAKVVRKVAS